MWKGSIPESFINELLVRSDIVDVIDNLVPLKKTGKDYESRCPFHDEKTPSFTVSRQKQFYHCFGCGASGNSITFLMEHKGLNFTDAIEDLASISGIPVVYEKSKNSDAPQESLSHLYELNEKVAKLFVKSRNSTANDYLKNRGLDDDIIDRFQIGYAPDEYHSLEKLFDKNDLFSVGLLAEKDGSFYNRFRDRITFPIRDNRARIIGFGGRILQEKGHTKYLNSPESKLFNKGQEVYGLYELLQANNKPERILVTEGYMDVIALAQQGITYSVAALGTAPSEAHVKLLFRFTSEIVFCFDGDTAGRKAAWRAVEAALPNLKEGKQIKVILLPEGQDPDSLIREHGKSYFDNLITNATSLSDYFFSYLSVDLNINTIEGKSSLIKDAQLLLSKIPPGVFKDLMMEELKNVTKVTTLPVQETAPKKSFMMKLTTTEDITLNRSPVRSAIFLLLLNPSLRFDVVNEELINDQISGVPFLKLIMKKISAAPSVNGSGIIQMFADSPEEMQLKQLFTQDNHFSDDEVKVEFMDSIEALIATGKKMRLDALCKKEDLTDPEKEELLALLS